VTLSDVENPALDQPHVAGRRLQQREFVGECAFELGLADVHGATLTLAVVVGVLPVAPLRPTAGERPTARVAQQLEQEQRWGVESDAPYAQFAAEIGRVTTEVAALVRQLRSDGKRVCAYGAAAKGTVLINACRLGADEIDFVCDKNPLKQGRLMPGVHVPIVAPSHMLASNADYCLLLAWNVADEIRREQAAWAERGGRFIVPIPTVQVLP